MGQIPEVDVKGSREDEVNKRQKKKLFNRKCGYRLVKLPHNFRAVDVMIMAQVYFQAVLFRIFPVWSSKYVMLVQDSVFIPIVMECYAEITCPAVFIM